MSEPNSTTPEPTQALSLPFDLDPSEFPDQPGATTEEAGNTEPAAVVSGEPATMELPFELDPAEFPNQPDPLALSISGAMGESALSESPAPSFDERLTVGITRQMTDFFSRQPEPMPVTPDELGEFQFRRGKSFEEQVLDAVGMQPQQPYFTDPMQVARQVGYEEFTPWVNERDREGLEFLSGLVERDRTEHARYVSAFTPGGADLTSDQARAEAANIYAMSLVTGKPPSWVRRHIKELNSETFETYRPLHQAVEEIAMTGFVSAATLEMLSAFASGGAAAGLVSALKFAGGVTGYELLGQFGGMIRDKFAHNEEMEGQPFSLLELAPEDSGELTKTALVLLDMGVKGKVIHQGYRGLQWGWDRIGYETSRSVLPMQSLYLPADRVEPAFESGAGLSPLEFEIVRGLRLSPREYQWARDFGVHLEVPNIVLLEQADRPWLSKVKGLMNVTPYELTDVRQEGRPTVTFGREAAEKAGTPARAEATPAGKAGTEEVPGPGEAAGQPAGEITPETGAGTVGAPVEGPVPGEMISPAPVAEVPPASDRAGAEPTSSGARPEASEDRFPSQRTGAVEADKAASLAQGTLKEPAGYVPARRTDDGRGSDFHTPGNQAGGKQRSLQHRIQGPRPGRVPVHGHLVSLEPGVHGGQG